jgi:hypothetical protein
MSAIYTSVDVSTPSSVPDGLRYQDQSKRGDQCTESRQARRPLSLTAHALARAARRNVAPDAVEYVLTYGRRIQRTGVTFYFLGKRDMPPADQCASWASRLEGTIVVVAPDGNVITVYRNRRGMHAIQRKLKYRLPGLGRCWARSESNADAVLWKSA